ncbi:MAG TPA: DUF3305 domain-containing protein [Pseudolabrys sp.]
MSNVAPLASIAVGVVVERSKSASPWADFYWRPLGVLGGAPETAPWTKLSDDGERVTFYAGTAEIELYRTETGYYRGNLQSGAPALWVSLRPTGAEPPYAVGVVTADPAEGEGMTETATDLVEQVPMPEVVRLFVEAFVAEHHVEERFVKRKRDRADPEALARGAADPAKERE